jgi:hypothetical protein
MQFLELSIWKETRKVLGNWCEAVIDGLKSDSRNSQRVVSCG